MSTLDIETHGEVARLWLNRPDVHNAFDEVLIAELTGALRRLDADRAIRVVVLGARGESFCAGGDLAWMRRMAAFSEAENLRDAAQLAEMLHVLHSLGKPTIARVQGAALAGGTGLVAACDIALATHAASFGIPEVRVGLIPATISPYLIQAIGARAARRYFLSAERFDAAQALRLGLVHEICAAHDLDARIDGIIKALLAGGPDALADSKRLVDDVAGHAIDAALVAETSRRIAAARASREGREGIAAFFEKRKPDWAR